MKKILNQQIEHLVKLEELAIISNDVLDASNIELQSMAQDLSDISGKLTTIISSSKEKDLKETTEEKKKEEKKKEEKKKEDKSLEELKKISAALRVKHNIEVSDKALNDPVYHNMYTRMDLLKESFGKLKNTFKNNDTGETTARSTFKGMANNVASIFSKDARNRNQYITTERAAGNTLSDKKLKEQYKERQRLLYHNNKNERNMNENRGLLSKEEFLKANTTEARKYQEEQQRIGERLSQIDSRYKFQEPEEKKKEETAPVDPPTSTDKPISEEKFEKDNDCCEELSKSILSIKTAIDTMAEKIVPLTSSNVSSDIETQLETTRSTKLFQDKQLESMNDQTKILDKTLEIQKLILEELKKRTEEIIKKKETTKKTDDTDKDIDVDINKSRKTKKDRNNRRPIPTRNNGRKRRRLFGRLGLGAAVAVGAAEMSSDNDNIPSLVDVVPEERFPNRTPNTPNTPRTSTGNGLLDKTKGLFNKIPGASVLKNAGKMALRVAGPVGAALTAYEVGSTAIDAYDESFGDGGKKVVQDLHHKKIISYNFGDSEVLDWKGIEELPTEDLKKLINAKIRFKPEDDVKLHEVLSHKLVTGDKPTTETPKNIPEVKSEIGNVYSEDVKKIYNNLKENNTFSVTKSELLEDAISEAQFKGLDVYSKDELDKVKPLAQQLDIKNIQSETKIIPEAVKPKISTPEAANAIYDKSAEVANNTSTASTVINNVTAPTNVTQQSSTPVIKMDPRNRESTVSRLFGNRNSFY